MFKLIKNFCHNNMKFKSLNNATQKKVGQCICQIIKVINIIHKIVRSIMFDLSFIVISITETKHKLESAG